jgi:hypothetical protein
MLATAMLEDFKAGLVPMVHGNPGIGKSDVTHRLATKNKWKLIDLRLSQLDPTDLSGFPSLNADKTRSHYAPPDYIPLINDPIPQGYNGWLLFLDEITSAPPATQAAAYKLVLDRKIQDIPLHANLIMTAAGNLSTDKAIVNTMSTALQSRMQHYQLRVDLKQWIVWANANDVDHRIVSYISYKPEVLHSFNPNHDDFTFPCPRTWYFLSKKINVYPGKEIVASKIASMSASVGEAAAREFYAFSQIYKDIPTIPQIITDPDGAIMSNEPSAQYAMSGMLGENFTNTNIPSLLRYMQRMPIEFQILAMQRGRAKSRDFRKNRAVGEWINKNSEEMFGD